MANVLLLRPGPDKLASRRKFVPDLGIGYLSSTLKAHEHRVCFVDLNAPGLGPDALANVLRSECFDLVGIKAFSNETPHVVDCLQTVKSLSPQSVSILGGPHPSGMGVRVLEQFPQLDLAQVSEAESGLPMLAALVAEHGRDALERADDLASIPGLVYRSDNGAQANERALVEDLDSLGLPDFEAMNLRWFVKHPACFFGQYIPLMTGRGCPMPCTYCAARLISGRQRRVHGLDYLLEYLRRVRDDYGASSFSLIDDHFLAESQFALAFCNRLVDEQIGLRWQCASNGVRAEMLSEELVRAMERSGCRFISVGIESGAPRVLELMKRRVDVQTLYEKIAMVRRVSSIRVCGFHVLGFPGETEQEREQTLRGSLRSRLDYADFLIFQPFPGSVIGDRMLGSMALETLANIDYDRPTTAMDPQTALQVKRFQRKAYLRFYLRPRVLFGALVRGPSLRIMFKNLLSVFMPSRGGR
ncbi:MAG: radical SAM protein [Candidatus Alcyoniella australis]|nr:radical SAM protein [Candidatus Alcyoniella australis]